MYSHRLCRAAANRTSKWKAKKLDWLGWVSVMAGHNYMFVRIIVLDEWESTFRSSTTRTWSQRRKWRLSTFQCWWKRSPRSRDGTTSGLTARKVSERWRKDQSQLLSLTINKSVWHCTVCCFKLINYLKIIKLLTSIHACLASPRNGKIIGLLNN